MKKQKVYIIIIAILLILLITIVILILTKDDENPSNVEEPEDIAATFQTLINNDYLYYYYFYGDVEIGEGYIEENGERYYYVTDETITNMDKSINVLISETYLNISLDELLNPEDANQYIQLNGIYYVKKSSNVCHNVNKYNLDNISYESSGDESMFVIFDETSTHIYSVDGPWKLRSNLSYCLD